MLSTATVNGIFWNYINFTVSAEFFGILINTLVLQWYFLNTTTSPANTEEIFFVYGTINSIVSDCIRQL